MTTIEWTDRTWNPTVGCSRVSPGCDNCYAIGVAHRAMQPAHAGLTIRTEGRTDWTGEVRCLPDRLSEPFRWRKPSRVFVDSMSDLFHPDVPLDFILRVWTTMMAADQHTFQVLTKRPQRMAKIVDAIAWDWHDGWHAYPWPGEWEDEDGNLIDVEEADLNGGGEKHLPNVWLGTSIESDQYTWRAEYLRNTPAAVRFLSLEPLLGPLPSLDLTGIDWVIVGGESGPGARPMHPDWVRDIRDRCVTAGVPFFFKQWGDWVEDPRNETPSARDPKRLMFHPAGMTARTPDNPFDPWSKGHPYWRPFVRVGKKTAGRELDGRTWDQMPEVTS